ncbi:hypothetical protein GE061_013693 [Apolygus lucorum]|uniref:Uncharacterized protein n=1 Tax=Apolygus lucorum TaxID=248454 RepID=A0A6A4JYJ3_APOLU|nr:hypothetical protein GE061_013693 [Apolygus lucorum]
MPYRSKILDHSFFKNYGQENNVKYSSIRPGRPLPTEPKVVDIRSLLYLPDGKIMFKLNFADEFKELPARPKSLDLAQVSFPPLFSSRINIPLDKFRDLQSLKTFMPTDTHHFFDNLPHQGQSIRLLKRQEKKEETQRAQLPPKEQRVDPPKKKRKTV